MPSPSLLQRLKERKLVQWALAYAAGAFVVFQGVEVMADPWSISPGLQRAIHVLLLLGLLLTLVLAWYHGEKGRQRVSGPELLMVAALLVIAGGVLSLLGPEREEVPPSVATPAPRDEDDKPGVAVLLCDNLSTDPADEFLAASLHDEILLKLQKISSLSSIGRTSVLQYAEDPPATNVIASALGVGFVGECSVQKYEDRIRLIFQLMDGSTGVQVWANNYDRHLTIGNLLDIQSDVAQQVAHAIGAILTQEEETRIEAVPTENLEAYEAYLLGRYHLYRRDRAAEAFSQAERFFRIALQQDPELAIAHAGLAFAYFSMAAWDLSDPRELWPQVEQWARSALAIDPTVPDAHQALALWRWATAWDWEGAERGFQRAIELDPSDPVSRLLNADFLMAQGRMEEGLEEGRIASGLDPFSSPMLQAQAGWVLHSRRYEEAVPLKETLLTRDPGNLFAAWNLALCFLIGGQPEQVVGLFPTLPEDPASLDPDAWTAWALALSLAGEADSARVEIERAVSSAGDRYFTPNAVWATYAALGEKDKAFRWMERAIEAQSYSTKFFGITPLADPLRDDPRYQAILDRIGLGHLKERFDSLAAADPRGGT